MGATEFGNFFVRALSMSFPIASARADTSHQRTSAETRHYRSAMYAHSLAFITKDIKRGWIGMATHVSVYCRFYQRRITSPAHGEAAS